MSAPARRARFAELHDRDQVFVMPNPWDLGSARLLAGLGFEALATTSAGFAWSLGRDDYGVTRDELVEHVRVLSAAVDLPLNVDSERCFADDLDGVTETVRRLHGAGAAGCSIEDWNGPAGRIDPLDVAAERVAAASRGAGDEDRLVLTARCENLLHGVDDLADTIERLVAYAAAGADCVYAPGLSTVDQIRAVADAVQVPINVLAVPNGPTIAEIGEAGGRRVSIGGALASTAYGAMMAGARELLETGTSTYLATRLSGQDRRLLQQP
ncbi:MAG: isocitrate lyase/phosphoenolpyruvate mutase family protein [Ilumatobacter sp.]|nr:isocitrate lyase/phosphoenolpyruvate mutase family protein [Ilumatobacter sp.]